MLSFVLLLFGWWFERYRVLLKKQFRIISYLQTLFTVYIIFLLTMTVKRWEWKNWRKTKIFEGELYETPYCTLKVVFKTFCNTLFSLRKFFYNWKIVKLYTLKYFFFFSLPLITLVAYIFSLWEINYASKIWPRPVQLKFREIFFAVINL